jgi:hypothetical protein
MAPPSTLMVPRAMDWALQETANRSIAPMTVSAAPTGRQDEFTV